MEMMRWSLYKYKMRRVRALRFFPYLITVHTPALLSEVNKYKEISIIYNGLIIISYICCYLINPSNYYG